MNYVRRAVLVAGLAAWVSLMAAACVHEAVRHPRADLPVLMVARSGEKVLLQWSSRLHELYSIMWADSGERTAAWKPLPGAVRIPGTGGPLSVEDRVPAGVERHYRLSVEEKPRQRP